MQVARSAGQQDRPRPGRSRSERALPIEPRADRLRGHPLLHDVAVADRPPHADLPHRRQQHLVDAGAEAQRRRRLVEPRADRWHIQSFGGAEDLVDQVLRRSLPAHQPANGLRGGGGLLTTSDLVTHQAQGMDFVRTVSTMLAGTAAQRGDAVAELPGTQRRHRHAQDLGHVPDRNAPGIPETVDRTGRLRHASLSLARQALGGLPEISSLPDCPVPGRVASTRLGPE